MEMAPESLIPIRLGGNPNYGISSQKRIRNTLNLPCGVVEYEIGIAISHHQNASAIGTDRIPPWNSQKCHKWYKKLLHRLFKIPYRLWIPQSVGVENNHPPA